MNERFSIITLGLGLSASMFTHELVEKVITTVIAMAIGTIISFYLRKYLERKYKK